MSQAGSFGNSGGGGQTSSFSASLQSTTNDVTGDNSTYDVIYDTVTQTADNSFDLVTGIFTAPKTDYYLLTCSTWIGGVIPSQHFNFYSRFLINGGPVSYVTAALNLAAVGTTDTQAAFPFSVIVVLNEGDTVNVQIQVIGQTKIIDVLGNSNTYGTTFTGASLNIL